MNAKFPLLPHLLTLAQSVFIMTLICAPALASKPDAFGAAEKVRPTPSPAPTLPPHVKRVTLNVGEIVEVFTCSKRGLFSDPNEDAFYLPPEAAVMLQLVVEKKGNQRTFFVKAIKSGETVGGVVKRQWLDAGGLRARDLPHEARIQEVIKKAPYIFVVEPAATSSPVPDRAAGSTERSR